MSRPGPTVAQRLTARHLLHPIPVIRHASTSTAPPPPPLAASTSTLPSTPLPLTWPNYLSLRRQRRVWSGLCTVPTTAAGLGIGGGYFASLETDMSQLIMGVEAM